MKPIPPQEDDEPIVVLVLFVLAGICVLGGFIHGAQLGSTSGLLFGALLGCASALGFWALAVIIRILHRIERNNRR
jgi:hypothetical protein